MSLFLFSAPIGESLYLLLHVLNNHDRFGLGNYSLFQYGGGCLYVEDTDTDFWGAADVKL